MSVVQEEVYCGRSPFSDVCTRIPRLPPSRRRRPGLQTAVAGRCRTPPPAATDKMSVVQEEVHRVRSPVRDVCTRIPRLPPSRRRRLGLQTASLVAVEFRLQRRRTRCPSYKKRPRSYDGRQTQFHTTRPPPPVTRHPSRVRAFGGVWIFPSCGAGRQPRDQPEGRRNVGSRGSVSGPRPITGNVKRV